MDLLKTYKGKHPADFKKWWEKYAKGDEMKEFLASHHEDEDEVAINDEEDFWEAVEQGLDNDDLPDLEQTLDTANRWGWERGTESEKYKMIKNYLFDYDFQNLEDFHLNIVDKVGWFESVVEIWAPVEHCLQAVEEGFDNTNTNLIDFFSGDLQGRKFTGEYQSDYDVEGAMEYLVEGL
jgi:hypothetical protein